MSAHNSTQEFIEITSIQDGIIFLKDGSASLIIKTTGVNFELLSADEKKAVIAAFSALLNSLTFPLQIIVRSQKKDIAPYISLLNARVSQEQNPRLKDQIEKYRDFIQNLAKKNSILEKNFYLVIPFYRAPLSNQGLEEIKKTLFPRRDHLLGQLRRLGLKGEALTYQELIILFHNIFNSEALLPPQTVSPTDNIRDILAPSLAEVDFNSLKIGNRFYKTLFVLNYPRFVSPNWLSPLISFDHTLDISFFIYPTQVSDALSDLRRKIGELEATLASDAELGRVENPQVRAALEDAYLLQEELTKGTEHFFQFGFYITIPADSQEELERVAKMVQSTLSSLLLVAKPSTLQMEDGFKTTLPLGIDRLLILRNMDTTSLATAFPFATSSLSANEGILYGINKNDDSLIIFDRFTLENANSVVFGKSGGGKSYLIKLEILRSLMFGTEIIIIDPESEYQKLAEAVGGAFLPFSASAPIKINPFDLSEVSLSEEENELGAKISSLHGLLKIIMGEISPVEAAVLDRALVETYQKAGITADPQTQKNQPPVMENLYNILLQKEEAEAKILASRLERFIKGSLAGIFNQRSNIEIKNPFTVFSIKDLEEELRPIAMYIILDYIWTRIRKIQKKRILVIDEAWYLMKYEDSASFVYSIAKRARKYSLGLTTITQDVEDFLGSSYGKPILSNSSIQILLKQSPASIEQVAKTFFLSEGEKLFLLSANVGEGLFFAGQNHVGMNVISAPFEHQIIASNPQEIIKDMEVK